MEELPVDKSKIQNPKLVVSEANPSKTQNRQRITFATAKTLAYVSVLELGLVWEHALRRAGAPVKYSQGFNPRPKMHFAAPLPVGCGCEADLLDVWLTDSWSAADTLAALHGQTPPDLTVVAVADVPPDEPALSEQLVAAEYRVWLRDVTQVDVAAAVAAFLEAEAVSQPKRGGKHKGMPYDLRPLVQALEVRPAPAPWIGLWMRLAARVGATGRPDEVLKALGLVDAPRRCTRERLILESREVAKFDENSSTD